MENILGVQDQYFFLRLRPRLLVDGIKVWDWDWDFSLWSQIMRLRLRLLTLGSRIETLKRWSQGLRLRPPKSQSRDQSLAQLWDQHHHDSSQDYLPAYSSFPSDVCDDYQHNQNHQAVGLFSRRNQPFMWWESLHSEMLWWTRTDSKSAVWGGAGYSEWR